nr:MAG TPA: hypothetical protein [Caudoviricetes sp.]
MSIPKRPVGMFQIAPVKSSNFRDMPNPDQDSFQGLVATLVNSARNAKGVVTAQKICRDQDKFTLKFSALSRAEWESLLSFWNSNFTFKLRYYSPELGKAITRVFYISDRTYNYLGFERDSKGKYNYNKPTGYTDCSASIVDTGESK